MNRVTVLMPVFNAEPYLKRAIQSILQQTYKNFLFLIIDDGSTDGTRETISSFKDQRIRYVPNNSNIGLARTLNKGLAMIDSEYIVRMDADDISHRRRLEWQVDFMDSQKEIGVSGTWLKIFGDLKALGYSRYLTQPEELRLCTLFRTPVAHPSVIIRNSANISDVLSYDPHFNRTEDYDLWERMIATIPFSNIPRVAYYYRRHSSSATMGHPADMINQYRKIVMRQLDSIGILPTERQLVLHEKIGLKKDAASIEELYAGEEWLKIIKSQAETAGFQRKIVDNVLSQFWFWFCRNSALLGEKAAELCYGSELFYAESISVREKLLFKAACCYHRGRKMIVAH